MRNREIVKEKTAYCYLKLAGKKEMGDCSITHDSMKVFIVK